MRTKNEIEDVMFRADPYASSRYPGMSYECGVHDALRWVTGGLPDNEREFPFIEDGIPVRSLRLDK